MQYYVTFQDNNAFTLFETLNRQLHGCMLLAFEFQGVSQGEVCRRLSSQSHILQIWGLRSLPISYTIDSPKKTYFLKYLLYKPNFVLRSIALNKKSLGQRKKEIQMRFMAKNVALSCGREGLHMVQNFAPLRKSLISKIVNTKILL